ncbi:MULTISPECIES: NADP-dependent malic enzyme [Kordiimonas]|jgi:malate dehydrogenase (oxaloacetate-decarboxylating)(NADP+)|uniref:Malate dehydrogenase (Oxaloacetate-decarboxylating)(NADP+) n=1 Tax=Kordiimonas lacus TaxID=637679 RepID=A0A1G6TTA7_9PROT|nr:MULTISPECIES: NADP-dependent malic enzyme [Kordiimonas]SDD32261.1 malate dehydrogenase (oxaloacetate-decarboxylating)(NADP+) [Kordiimonas lacus]
MPSNSSKFTDAEALRFHSAGRPGKLEITPSKPMATQRDLSLAYSPGVAVPVKAIAEDIDTAYDYTTKGNLVAVISNGTAILGLGNLGAAASKPVMEGKSVLFKRFADVDSIDLEVDSEDIDEFVNCVKLLGPSFGGINLEDIAAPECFIIEQRLRELMDIPVFHDDQHGTAIITAAGFINALDLTGRDLKTTKVVALGAGAACIACIELIKAMGLPHENVTMVDRTGVIYAGRTEGMNQWKSAHAIKTDARTLEEALVGADAVIGLAAAGAITKDMVKKMAAKPIIFAMANPDPEITPEDAREARPDAIIATGRSDYPNQVNNVLGFPYIFRGALDVRARTINEEMKIAAATALAELAREDVPEEVAAAYGGKQPHYGPEYIIPAPFDPRLIRRIPVKVAKAAMDTGVARKPIEDLEAYEQELSARLDPTADTLSTMFEDLKHREPKRIVFAEAEEEKVLRAAVGFKNAGYGVPILVGYEAPIREKLREMGVDDDGFEIWNAANTKRTSDYIDYIYERLNRRGFLLRDVQRLVKRDRNVFSACMVATGDADGMITGVTRHYWRALKNIRRVIDPIPGHRPFGMSIVVTKGRTVFMADTTVNERPNAEELADIAESAAYFVKRLGHEPRVAFLSFSNFGNPPSDKTQHIQKAVSILDERDVDFEYDGEMQADVALNRDLMEQYPFMRLSGPANVLVMPALHSANIGYKLLTELGGARVIGPMLLGMEHSIQVARMTASASDLVNMAGLAASTAFALEQAREELSHNGEDEE